MYTTQPAGRLEVGMVSDGLLFSLLFIFSGKKK